MIGKDYGAIASPPRAVVQRAENVNETAQKNRTDVERFEGIGARVKEADE